MDYKKWDRVSEVIFRLMPESLRASGGARQTAQYLAGQSVLAVAVDRRIVAHLEYWVQEDAGHLTATVLSAWIDPDYVGCRLFQRLVVLMGYVTGAELLLWASDARDDAHVASVPDAKGALSAALEIINAGQSKVLRCLSGP